MEQFTIKDSTIAFIGLGLIGGSTCKGLKAGPSRYPHYGLYADPLQIRAGQKTVL